jgi:hypothetical protein
VRNLFATALFLVGGSRRPGSRLALTQPLPNIESDREEEENKMKLLTCAIEAQSVRVGFYVSEKKERAMGRRGKRERSFFSYCFFLFLCVVVFFLCLSDCEANAHERIHCRGR